MDRQVRPAFQQRQIQRLLHILALHTLGQMRRQINGQLLIADGVIENGFADGFEIGQLFLLLLLGAACHGQLAAQILIWAVPRHLMAEFHAFEFGAVHQDDAAFGVGIRLQRMIRPGIKAGKALICFGDGLCFLGKRVHAYHAPRRDYIRAKRIPCVILQRNRT